MTIDEAIKHCEELVRDNRDDAKYAIENELHDAVIKTCTKCAEEHEQLAKWLEELKEYKELEEQGLLVKLPCKISGWMYDTSINFNAVTPIRTDEVIIYELNNKYYYQYNCCNFDAHGDVYEEYEIDANDIGKTVFLTRAAAEEALEKIKEGGIDE